MSDMYLNSITKLLIPKIFARPNFRLIYKPFDVYKRINIKFSKRFMSVLLSKTQDIHTTIRVLVQTPDYGNMGCRIFKEGCKIKRIFDQKSIFNCCILLINIITWRVVKNWA